MSASSADLGGALPVLLLLGEPCGGIGERLATAEEVEAQYTYDPIRQRTVEKIECKGPTFMWVSTGKGDRSEKRRAD